DGGRDHSRRLPELLFRAPEAAEAEEGGLGSGREGRRQRGAEHRVAGRHRHLLVAAGQRVFPARQLQLGRIVPHLYALSSSGGGKPCCFRPTGPSCLAVTLYASNRPSPAFSAQRLRSASISAGVIGTN